MKKTVLTLAIIMMAVAGSIAQTKKVSNSSWVVESNPQNKGVKIVRFYDDNSRLIYSETVKGRLNINRKKIQVKLNNMLEQLVANGNPKRDSNMFASSLKVREY
jgi:hypothetical protein